MSLYGLIIGLSILLVYHRASKKNKIIPKSKLDFFFFGLIVSGIIGARLYHVFHFWHFYSQNLSKILDLRAGGLGIFGALIAGFLFVYFFSKITKISFLKITNLITPYLPLAQSIARLGNFFNQEIPTWWIESLANLALFFYIQKFPKNPTSKYLIGYGLIRFFYEFLRLDTWQIYGFKTAQLLSLVFVVFGIKLLFCDPGGIRTRGCLDENQES